MVITMKMWRLWSSKVGTQFIYIYIYPILTYLHTYPLLLRLIKAEWQSPAIFNSFGSAGTGEVAVQEYTMPEVVDIIQSDYLVASDPSCLT